MIPCAAILAGACAGWLGCASMGRFPTDFGSGTPSRYRSVAGVRTAAAPAVDLTQYARIAVLGASSNSEERALADQLFSQFVDMGLQVVAPAQTEPLFSPARGRRGTLDIRRALGAAKAAEIDAIAMVSLQYRRGTAWIRFELTDVRRAATVLESVLQYEGGLSGRLEYHKIARAITDDIRNRLLANPKRGNIQRRKIE
ncbi:MAG: hypothetical protein HY551_06765 [Elusimicrobia bacterium]|nr:hypothetical protein [Elusimicrobiota bacterium]